MKKQNTLHTKYKYLCIRLKEFKIFFLKRKPIVYISKITRVQQGTAFSTVLYKNDAKDQPTSFF